MNRTCGIYIHIPFCVRKCRYCAFLSFAADEASRQEYADAICEEIRLGSPRYAAGAAAAFGKVDLPEADTIYIGGGTPSVMEVSGIADIMGTLRSCYDIRPDVEITLEVNPGTLGNEDGTILDRLEAYRSLGINRLSMGVQSMDNTRLGFLGRIHSAEDVERDMKFIRQAGFNNVNLDLMFSVPGENQEDAAAGGVALRVGHHVAIDAPHARRGLGVVMGLHQGLHVLLHKAGDVRVVV